MSSGEDLKSSQEAAQRALINVTKTVNQIAADDLNFLRASDPAAARQLDSENDKLLGIAKSLIHSAAKGFDLKPPRLTDVDSVDDNWNGIVEVIDKLLERADTALDEYTGVIKRKAPDQEQYSSTPNIKLSSKKHVFFGPKPQLLFNRPPINDEITPWRPLLKSKPHALVPLGESLQRQVPEDPLSEFNHPYEYEIRDYRYPDRVYSKAHPVPYKALHESKPTYVDNFQGVLDMLEKLKYAKEFAIDLEHHDKHSYVGLVSLMQISTREHDWIIDTLQPWREDLQILNEVFADPSIVKVMHGTHMDIIWLQRDLGLYVVGLFDTYFGAMKLNYERKSLAWLLEKFTGFEAQKKYQMADWRIRPLPQELLDYARSDTHFLLYIFDMVRNELIDNNNTSGTENNLIEYVQEESKKNALQKYERPVYDAKTGTGNNGWYFMLSKTPSLFDKEQFATFRAVHNWRDLTARKEDESLISVMPNHVIHSIARHMPLSVSELLGCMNPVTDIARARAQELIHIIKEAKTSGEKGPDMKEFMRNHPLTIEHENMKAERGQYKAHRVATGPFLAKLIQDDKKLIDDTRAVVMEKSRFWGKIVENSYGFDIRGFSQNSASPEHRLRIPLPPLTAQIYETTEFYTVDERDSKTLTESQVLEDYAPPSEDKTFVVRELGRRSKRKVDDSGNPQSLGPKLLPSENSGLHDAEITGEPDWFVDSHIEQEATEAERKARKRENKIKKRAGATMKVGEASREVAFDYENAPSVMKSRPEKTLRTTKQTVNPYTKSMDAPRGMRKSNKDTGGKSHTFKN